MRWSVRRKQEKSSSATALRLKLRANVAIFGMRANVGYWCSPASMISLNSSFAYRKPQ